MGSADSVHIKNGHVEMVKGRMHLAGGPWAVLTPVATPPSLARVATARNLSLLPFDSTLAAVSVDERL